MLKKNPKLNTSSDAAAYGIASTVPDRRVAETLMKTYIENLLEVHHWFNHLLNFQTLDLSISIFTTKISRKDYWLSTLFEIRNE